MDIKCIALDLDRTTLNAQGRLSDGNRKALLSLPAGVPFIHFQRMSCQFPELNMPLLPMAQLYTIFPPENVCMNTR